MNIDWDRAASFLVHRTGPLFDMELYREKFDEASQYWDSVYGGSPVVQVVVEGADSSAEEMLASLKMRHLTTYLKRWAWTPQLRVSSTNATVSGGLPETLFTGRAGRSKLGALLSKNQASQAPVGCGAKMGAADAAMLESAALYRNILKKTQAIRYVCRFSRDPYHLCRLGQLKCDGNACFAVGGQGQSTPLVLGMTPGGFIVEVWREDQPWITIGRAWGFLRENSLMITNVYPNTQGADQQHVRALLDQAAVKMGYMGVGCPGSILGGQRQETTLLGTEKRVPGARCYTNADCKVYGRAAGSCAHRWTKVSLVKEGVPYVAKFPEAPTVETVFGATTHPKPFAGGGYVPVEIATPGYRRVFRASLTTDHPPTMNEQALFRDGSGVLTDIVEYKFCLDGRQMALLYDGTCTPKEYARWDCVNKQVIHWADAVQCSDGFTLRKPEPSTAGGKVPSTEAVVTAAE